MKIYLNISLFIFTFSNIYKGQTNLVHNSNRHSKTLNTVDSLNITKSFFDV